MDSTNYEQLMKENFGEMTPKQLWALVRFAKNVRLRCRNNAAFNNFCNRTFPYAQFRQVTKNRPSRINPGQMESYPGLQIEVKGQTVEESEGEE